MSVLCQANSDFFHFKSSLGICNIHSPLWSIIRVPSNYILSWTSSLLCLPFSIALSVLRVIVLYPHPLSVTVSVSRWLSALFPSAELWLPVNFTLCKGAPWVNSFTSSSCSSNVPVSWHILKTEERIKYFGKYIFLMSKIKTVPFHSTWSFSYP